MLQGARMGGGIDAARHARRDQKIRFGEIRGDGAGEIPSIGRGVAGADDRHRIPGQQACVAEDREGGRGVVERGKRRRIVRFAIEEMPASEPLQRLTFAFRRFDGADPQRTFAAAPRGEIGQGGEGLPGAAIAAQQLPEGDRADIFAARQTKPVEPLLRGQSR